MTEPSTEEKVEDLKEDSVRLDGADQFSDISSEAPSEFEDEVEEEEEEPKELYLDNNYWRSQE